MLLSEAVSMRCSVKMLSLKVLENSETDTCATISFLMKLQVQVISSEFCETLKNSLSTEHFLETASVLPWWKQWLFQPYGQ